MPRNVLALLALLFVATTTHAEQPTERTARVIAVSDGDTITVRHEDGRTDKVRFLYCDCPERDQPYGNRAAAWTARRCQDQPVTLRLEADRQRDDHGRLLAEIVLADGTSLNEELVTQGLAVWFYHHSTDGDGDRRIADAELEATKRHKRGLWAQENPIYPRNWRAGARVRSGDQGDTRDPPADQPAVGPLVIASILPNPHGEDRGREAVTLTNRGDAILDLANWRLLDADRGSLPLVGILRPGESIKVLCDQRLQLGNSGDTVRLVDPSGQVCHAVHYDSAAPGQLITASP